MYLRIKVKLIECRVTSESLSDMYRLKFRNVMKAIGIHGATKTNLWNGNYKVI